MNGLSIQGCDETCPLGSLESDISRIRRLVRVFQDCGLSKREARPLIAICWLFDCSEQRVVRIDHLDGRYYRMFFLSTSEEVANQPPLLLTLKIREEREGVFYKVHVLRRKFVYIIGVCSCSCGDV